MPAWSAKPRAAPSPTTARRNGRGSISSRLTALEIRSGHLKPPAKSGIAPDFGMDAVCNNFGGVPDILVSDVERSEAEAHEVGRTKIADHPAFDHRLDHGIAAVERDAYLAATQPRLPRRHDLKVRQQSVDPHHEKVRQCKALLPQGRHLDAIHGIQRGFDAAQRNDRLGAA